MISPKIKVTVGELRSQTRQLHAQIYESRIKLKAQNEAQLHLIDGLKQTQRELREISDLFLDRESLLQQERNKVLGLLQQLNDSCEVAMQGAQAAISVDEL